MLITCADTTAIHATLKTRMTFPILQPCPNVRISDSRLLLIIRCCSRWTAFRVSGVARFGPGVVPLLDQDSHTPGEAYELHSQLMLFFQFFKFSADLLSYRLFGNQRFFDMLDVDAQPFQRLFAFREERRHYFKFLNHARWC